MCRVTKSHLTLGDILKMECDDFSPPSERGLNQKQLKWSSVVVNEYVNHGQEICHLKHH
jgi:hypothetical protein